METVLFMRHAQSTYNVLGLCNDDPARPVPLTALGLSQADAAAERLKETALDLILVSELPRAQETAARINRHHGVPVKVDARLNDRRTGFEGRPVTEYLAARDTDPLGFRAPGGESFPELKSRVLEFVAEIERLEADRVLVVTHHEVLQVVHSAYAGIDDAAAIRFPVHNAEILEYPRRAP